MNLKFNNNDNRKFLQFEIDGEIIRCLSTKGMKGVHMAENGVNDLEKDEYSIIEINDNPRYSINEWPYEGKGEKVGTAILKMLGY